MDPTLPVREWLPPRREFERQITPHSRLRCRFQQRSDGVLYHLSWELILPMDMLQPESRRRAIQEDRRIHREQQWQGFLANQTTIKPVPLGWLVTRDPTHGGWEEVNLEEELTAP